MYVAESQQVGFAVLVAKSWRIEDWGPKASTAPDGGTVGGFCGAVEGGTFGRGTVDGGSSVSDNVDDGTVCGGNIGGGSVGGHCAGLSRTPEIL